MPKRYRHVRYQPDLDEKEIKPEGVALDQLETIQTEGVCLIARFTFAIPRFIIVKDQDPTPDELGSGKVRLGFSYGGVETTDPDMYHAADRELDEEAFNRKRVEVHFSREDYLGSKPVGVTHTMHFLTIDLDLKLKDHLEAGDEQEAVFTVPAYKIDEYIRDGIFLPDHAHGWEIYKKLFSHRLISATK